MRLVAAACLTGGIVFLAVATIPAAQTVISDLAPFADIYIVGMVAIVALQSALIAGLVVQSVRRRRTEQALRESESRFRVAAKENQDLAGRLINAQEEERTRIARDLHDDVSQQLAGLGILLSGLRARVARLDAEPEIEWTVMTLQDRTRVLAEAIRTLSHELHPSVLQHAGLSATLRRQCAEVEELHRQGVTFSAEGDLDSLDPEVALCLFRVTQEALNNAVRHARAGAISVRLRRADRVVELDVIDDGVGFAAEERGRRGLGLRSIDERVRLTGGSAHVESRPGQGTKLRVRIPWVAPRAELVRTA